VPYSNNQLDLGTMGSMFPHHWDPTGGTQNGGQSVFYQPSMMSLNHMDVPQAFWQDPSLQSAMNLNLQPYAGQYASGYAQVRAPEHRVCPTADIINPHSKHHPPCRASFSTWDLRQPPL
jgi:hypothetical protein